MPDSTLIKLAWRTVAEPRSDVSHTKDPKLEIRMTTCHVNVCGFVLCTLHVQHVAPQIGTRYRGHVQGAYEEQRTGRRC